MKLFKSRKGVELPMNLIIIAAILLIAMIVILAMFTNVFSRQRGQLENYVGQLDDCDEDGKANMFDDCPCDPEDKEGCQKKLVSCSKDKKECK